VSVADDKVSVTCPALGTVGNHDGVLDPGESVSCTASYAIGQGDLNRGSLTNVATASAGGTTSNEARVTVAAKQSPALSLVKSASPLVYSKVGEPIGYGYQVTNTGNVALAGPVSVADDKVSVTCPALTTVGNHDDVLDPGESVTCAASYAIGQADLNRGSLTNVATASAGGTTSNESRVTVAAKQAPALSLLKSASPMVYSEVGDLIGYRYDVSNTGNVALAGPVSVADDKVSVTCPALGTVGNHDSALDPGESMTCSASYAVVQADLNRGSLTNVATASAGGTTSNQDSVTVRVEDVAQLTPTEATCSTVSGGTAASLSGLQYTVQGSAINQVSPGAFFYWVKVKAKSASTTRTITQSVSPSLRPIALATGSFVWDANCVKNSSAQITQDAGGTVTVAFTGTGTFYIGLKYDAQSLKGTTVTDPSFPSFTYTLATTGQAGSTESLPLTPK
jgi:hypothetical protein